MNLPFTKFTNDKLILYKGKRCNRSFRIVFFSLVLKVTWTWAFKPKKKKRCTLFNCVFIYWFFRDKKGLEDSVLKLQSQVDVLKATDAQHFSNSLRSRDIAEQSAFEKAQSDIEIRRLRDELDRQHARVREMQHEMAKKISEERSLAERRYNYQVDQLGGDLSNQWETSSRLQLELERQKRAEADYRRDLAQKNSQIEEMRSEMKQKTSSLMSDLAQINAEKQSLEQEITSLRLQLERAERHTKIESSRLNAEIISLRQRLDRADADLLESKRENLRLGDQVASLEKEVRIVTFILAFPSQNNCDLMNMISLSFTNRMKPILSFLHNEPNSIFIIGSSFSILYLKSLSIQRDII